MPAVVNGSALIDTGASGTCIDQKAAEQAGLPVIDKAMMASASHAKHEVPVYGAKLVIPHFSAIDVEYAMGANLDEMNLIALIGRDLLQRAVLVYNGTDGSIALNGAYQFLVGGVAGVIEDARRTAARSVNAAMTAAYWLIGRHISLTRFARRCLANLTSHPINAPSSRS